jgi:hypothetical protein
MMDLPIDQELAEGKRTLVDTKSYEVEGKILRAFGILCVFNKNAQNTISERYGISREKFVITGIHDCRTKPFRISARKGFPSKWRVVCVGSGEVSYAGEWANNLPRTEHVSYEFIGPDWEWISKIGRSDLAWKGFMNQQELVNYVSGHADFGVVAYSERLNEYVGTYTCPSKFASYVASGTPIIVDSKCEYVSFLVEKFGLGLSLDSFDELPTVLRHLSESNYEGMRRRCLSLAWKLWGGYFFKRAVTEAILKLAK